MTTLAQDIHDGRQAVERLLDAIGVRGYTYTIEAKEGGWVVRVECATEDGWKEATLPVEPYTLCASLGDPAVQEKLRTEWAPHFMACMRREPGGEIREP